MRREESPRSCMLVRIGRITRREGGSRANEALAVAVMNAPHLALAVVVALSLAGCAESESYNTCVGATLANARGDQVIEELQAACARQYTEALPGSAISELDVDVAALITEVGALELGRRTFVTITNESQYWLIHRMELSAYIRDNDEYRTSAVYWKATGPSDILKSGGSVQVRLDDRFPPELEDSVIVTIRSGSGTWTGPPRPLWRRLIDTIG